MLVPGGEPARGNDIDRHAQQLGEFVVQMEEIKQRTARLELDQKVDVALVAVVVARDRTEERDGPSSMPSNGGFELRAMLLDECSERTHAVESTGPMLLGKSLERTVRFADLDVIRDRWLNRFRNLREREVWKDSNMTQRRDIGVVVRESLYLSRYKQLT